MSDQQKIRIRLKAYDHNVVDESSKKITETVVRTQAKVKGPVPLPTEIHRYCVIRGPHVDKDSREHFEMRIHKRLIDILGADPEDSGLSDASRAPRRGGGRTQVMSALLQLAAGLLGIARPTTQNSQPTTRTRRVRP